MKRVVVLVLFSLLNLEEAHSQQDSARPVDFNFVLNDDVAVLDTFQGTYTRDSDQPKVAVTITLKLTDNEMDEVFRALVRIDFWNDRKYPRVFSSWPSPTPRQSVLVQAPASHYVFTVTSMGRIKELNWLDNVIEPKYPPADELRAVFKTIFGFAQSKPEYKALPPSQARPRI